MLLECVTLWISNLMWQAEQDKAEINESLIAEKTEALIEAMKASPCHFFIVSNETGLGIMPMNAQARLFVDLAGRCNQLLAKAADRAIFMVSGLPMELKNV